MKTSPFPGMDPYLEPHWRDIHLALCAYSADILNQRLPEELAARVDLETEMPIILGVRQAGRRSRIEGNQELGPVTEPFTQRFIKIIDADQIVTKIYFAVPRKEREDRSLTSGTKRNRLFAGVVNVVEIDLTRPCDQYERAVDPATMHTRYCATIQRVVGTPSPCLEPFSLRKPLPTLRIPLRRGESPVELPLQLIVEKAYQTGRYNQTIDYTKPPEPPLDEEDAAWADSLLQSAGRR